MKARIRRMIVGSLSVIAALSLVFSEGAAFSANAAQNTTEVYSDAGTMEITSRRVTKAELYGNVPQIQKSVNEDNSVAVVNEELRVDIAGTDVIDYIRFAGAQTVFDQRKADVGEEAIGFHSAQTALAAVNDWSNLPISVEGGGYSTTATNFQGEGTVLTFTIPTVENEDRILTIYAGGHPHTGTITASAKIGNRIMAVKAGEVIASSYAFAPGSSQVTEYTLAYRGTGEELVVTFSLTGTEGMNWAGIAVAAAILRDAGVSEAEAGYRENQMVVEKKVVSKTSLYNNVPNEQKSVNPNNPVAVFDQVIQLDCTAANVIDYLHFTGVQEPERKQETAGEQLGFRSTQTGLAPISDWSNLAVTTEGGKATTTATNFLGEGSRVAFTVPTVAGEERILDIYAGGHPNTGTYTTTASLGETMIPIMAGDIVSDSYTYTPGSSQIVHYQLSYTGTGEELVVSISLSDTGGASWAGIGVAAAVLRQNSSALSPQTGNFNKRATDVGYRPLQTTLMLEKSVLFDAVLLGNEAVSDQNYDYNENTGVLTLKASYLELLEEGNHEFSIRLSNGDSLTYTAVISDSENVPRPYVKDTGSLSNPDLDAWNLWYQDEFDTGLNDWWEPSYLKWWNYSSESNEAYNLVEYSEAAGSNVLKQFTTENMRADSIVTRRDNFRNPGITLGVRDLIHNYGAYNLTNFQHMATDDRGATAYGYFEIRAKITGGTTAKTQSGSSAWWFTGFQDAPWQTVEVDMVEYGYGVNEANLNAHFSSPMHKWRDPFARAYPSTWNSTDKNLGVAKPADDYHIYGYEWTPEGMNGYFDGVLVWSKKISINYRMLMWISMNAHAYDTYTTDAKAHYIDYVRIWKTPELEQLEKQLVTKNIPQKQAPVENNIATLAYAGANGIRANHYRTYDPGYINDGDVTTSYRAMTAGERANNTYPVTPYHSDEHYLYLDWVEYTPEETAAALGVRETITDLKGVSYTLASQQDIREAKTIASVEVIVNKNVTTKTINAGKSDNSTGTFVYDRRSETANRFPYQFDIEYSRDGYQNWIPIATDITPQWNFDEKGIASFVTNVTPVQGVYHLRLHVKSVWNSETNQEESTDKGFYVAEIRVYEEARDAQTALVGDYHINHAVSAEVSVLDQEGKAGSEDANFPVGDVADGVYVNEFRSSGDGVRLAGNPNRVDTSVENVPDYPQYINFKWDNERTIDSLGFTIGYLTSAPTSFELQALQQDGTWKTVVTAKENWKSNFESKQYTFSQETTSQMRVAILAANKGPKLEYNGGIEGNGSRIVRIAGGYYSIAEIELNERK